MKKETKIFVLIIVISVAVLTALDIQTKGKITSLLGSVNPMNLKSSDVPYTNNSQSNVQDALDDLYIKASSAGGFDSDNIDISTVSTNSSGNVLASSKGVCFNYNGSFECFKINNYEEEKKHLKKVASVSYSDSNTLFQMATDVSKPRYMIYIYGAGKVEIGYEEGPFYKSCSVESGGSVTCN